MAAKDTQQTSFKAFVSSLRNKASGSSLPAPSGHVVPFNPSVLNDTRTPSKSKGTDHFIYYSVYIELSLMKWKF